MIRAVAAALLLWGLPHRAVAPTPAARDADGVVDRLAAIDRCRRAFASVADAARPRAADLARACADIYREPACAGAMRNPPADPSASASTIARACRDAYCPRLPAPRPRLCDAADLPLPSQLVPLWIELQQQILALELGVDPKALAPAVTRIDAKGAHPNAQQP